MLDRSLFKIKRKEHHDVIQTLGKMSTDVKRYKAVQLLMEQVFKVRMTFLIVSKIECKFHVYFLFNRF